MISPAQSFLAAAPLGPATLAMWSVLLACLACAGAGFHFGQAKTRAIAWMAERPRTILITLFACFLILPVFLPDRESRGDRGAIAWVITFGYFAAAGLCFWAAVNEKSQAVGRARRSVAPAFWYTMTGLLICLGFNKQLDLQTDLTVVGRELAVHEGWYRYRRIFQAIFVALFALGAVTAVVGAAWYLRDLFKRYRLAFIGIIYICTFVIIRAASFHHIDQILYHSKTLGQLVNTFLELGGIFLLAYAAFRAATAKPAQQDYKAFQRQVSIR